MTKLYALQTGQTAWQAQDRIESASGSPLTEGGAQNVAAAAQELRGRDIAVLYTGAGEAERQTAELVGPELDVKTRVVDDLRELDCGLWQGLTTEEVRRRHPKVYRQWTEAPGSVRPPGGETLAEAQDRLRSAVREIARRHRDEPVLLVLRPVMYALLRCLVRGTELDEIWQGADAQSTWDLYEIDGSSL